MIAHRFVQHARRTRRPGSLLPPASPTQQKEIALLPSDTYRPVDGRTVFSPSLCFVLFRTTRLLFACDRLPLDLEEKLHIVLGFCTTHLVPLISGSQCSVEWTDSGNEDAEDGSITVSPQYGRVSMGIEAAQNAGTLRRNWLACDISGDTTKSRKATRFEERSGSSNAIADH